VVIIVSMEVSQFCAPDVRLPDRIRCEVVPRPVLLGAAPDLLATAVVFDLAAERAFTGGVIDLVAPLEVPIALGCVRLEAADEASDPRRDREGDCSVDLRLVRDPEL
jgi:hypothetical protein